MDFTKIKILLVGYGSIGQAITPLLISHLHVDPCKLTIVTADQNGADIAEDYSIQFLNLPLTPSNYSTIITTYLSQGDLLINLSVGVSSLALVECCQLHGIFYLDTCVEPWEGGYNNKSESKFSTNCYLRHQILNKYVAGKSTAVIAHGANPGLVTHLLTAGLLELADIKGIKEWSSLAQLSQRLGIKVIQVAEIDSQQTSQVLPENSFANTWSITGFMSELWQLSEAGWGTHESFEKANSFDFSDTAVFFNNHSANVMVKSWLPSAGEISSMLITHHEAISIAEMLTIYNEGALQYRPTVYFAYQPSPLACESIQRFRLNNFKSPMKHILLRDTVSEGFDQLGLLFVYEGGSFWYGSTLSIAQAREVLPYNNATSLQVVAGIYGALMWMQKNPHAGIVEAESMDSQFILDIALPFLGEVAGYMSDWQPDVNGCLQLESFLLSGI